MTRTSLKKGKRKLRHHRVRAKVRGSLQRPRASIFRSNKHIYAQIMDDDAERTLLALSDLKLNPNQTKGKNKTEIAFLVGKELGEAAKKKKIKIITFDRGGFAYHGRVKAVAEGLREAGLEF